MTQFKRSHYLDELRKEDIGQSVTLSGWVHRRRDHGGLIFIDLRDYKGLTQVVFDPKVNEEAHTLAHQLRSEWVISIKGQVISRAEGQSNPKMKTGDIEIEVEKLEILSKAKTPPFAINEEDDTNEEIRLKYRYLDMRRGDILKALRLRHKVVLETRNFLDKHTFCEVQTPILGKSTPEGARDYLVPSRIYPGQFYALPQSPQLLKQILMVGGLDRYFQICPCFRDEDLRADRQPEFTQIDLEMSFETTETLFELIESLFSHLYQTCLGKQIKSPFKRMSYQDCMEFYGTDKPDLRIPIKLISINDIAAKSSFSIFLEAVKNNLSIKGMRVPSGASFSRRIIDNYTSFVAQFGIKGLAWMKYSEQKLQSNIVKFFDEELQKELIKRFDLQEGDIVFFVADQKDRTNQALDHLRRHIAKEHNLIDQAQPAFLWVVDFPLFHQGDEGQIESAHHPFTAPHPDDMNLIDSEPLQMRSRSYDLVLNGYELASGSERIYDSKVQEKIFARLNLSEEDIKEKFGFFVEALNYGTPPHLGIALGLERMMMILLNTENIKDVVAFPKTQRASDLMLESPSKVAFEQLTELQIKCKN